MKIIYGAAFAINILGIIVSLVTKNYTAALWAIAAGLWCFNAYQARRKLGKL